MYVKNEHSQWKRITQDYLTQNPWDLYKLRKSVKFNTMGVELTLAILLWANNELTNKEILKKASKAGLCHQNLLEAAFKSASLY